MKNESKAMTVVAVYILIMLIACVAVIANINLLYSEPSDTISESHGENEEPQKEIVYVPIYTESEDKPDQEVIENAYTIKACEGKIGVFSESGALLRIIDVNIKSLPKTDRDLLEKGFLVSGEDELLSIIEDYTG